MGDRVGIVEIVMILLFTALVIGTVIIPLILPMPVSAQQERRRDGCLADEYSGGGAARVHCR